MGIKSIIIIATACAVAMTGAATAHPGSKILTAGGNSERSAMTKGISYEDVGGVHVFRGRKAQASDKAVSTGAVIRREIRIEIAAPIYVWRSFRGLRTQGFYAGDPYPSRRYTQGFYSGR